MLLHWIRTHTPLFASTAYTVTDLDFEHGPISLPVPGKDISHADYFRKKGVDLKYPDKTPMVVVLGRRDQKIFLPAELVTGNELDASVRQKLPQIASFKPEVRNEAIEKIKVFLTPGAQHNQALLPAIGILLKNERITAEARVLPVPQVLAAGIPVPKRNEEFWAPVLSKAKFDVRNPKDATQLNVVVFHSTRLRDAGKVFDSIRNFVNGFNAHYQFRNTPYAIVPVGDYERHWGEVEKFFSSKNVPENLFVLDFVLPTKQSLDLAYPVIKQMLGKSGYLSQFVNFKTCSHGRQGDARKSGIILQGVARQILQKAGVRTITSVLHCLLNVSSAKLIFVFILSFHSGSALVGQNSKRGSITCRLHWRGRLSCTTRV